MDENISRAAGAAHGQLLDEDALEQAVSSAGRRLRRRTTLYDPVPDAPRHAVLASAD